MFRHKHAAILFLASDSLTNKAWVMEHESYLIPLQIKKLMKKPDLIQQFSHFIGDEIRREKGNDRIEIRLPILVRLSNRILKVFYPL